MRIHILGICGTFMGGVAALAKAAGHHVTGSDQNVYPPMSTQLRKIGIRLYEGYDAGQINDDLDCVIVGNVLSRGNPAIEALLDSGISYLSGPEWLATHVLADKWVLAVSGTHGKTTTASMLAWILDYAGLAPGFLIGGVPKNFSLSARLGQSKYFVVEADEYDTAFFDKRAKFVHYRPTTLVITNIEHDHADIYPDLDSIQWQFHQLLRSVPGRGLISVNGVDPNIDNLINRGVWTPVETFSVSDKKSTWWADYNLIGSKSRFSVFRHGEELGQTDWSLLGKHNLENALGAVSAAMHVDVGAEIAFEALSAFKGVKRRLEKRGVFGGATLYDDFAHHPTEVESSIISLKKKFKGKKVLAICEIKSNSMISGIHKNNTGSFRT